jgi:hypothetical protein
MAFDLKKYRDANLDYYGETSTLEDVARDLYDRGGEELHRGRTFEDWATSKGFTDQFQAEKNERAKQAEFKDRGFLRGLASDVVGGVVQAGETWARSLRAVTPQAGGLPDEQGEKGILTKGVEGIQKTVDETPFLQEDPNQGWLGKAVHGGVRSAVSSLTANLPAAGAGALAGSAVGGPVGAAIGAVAGFALSGGVTSGLSQYDDVLQRADAQGIPRSESEPAAIREGIYEGGFEFASDLLTGWMMGAGKLLTAPAKQALKLSLQDLTATSLKDLGKHTAISMAGEVGGEMATAAGQAYEEQSLGLGNQGMWDAAIDAIGPSAVASLIFAGVGHVNTKVNQGRIMKALENPTADQEQRLGAAQEVYKVLADYDKTLANTWMKSANEAIKSGKSITTNDNILDLETRVENLSKIPEKARTETQKKNLLSYTEQLGQMYSTMQTTPDEQDEELQFLQAQRRSAGPDTDVAAIDQRIAELQDVQDVEGQFQAQRANVQSIAAPPTEDESLDDIDAKVENLVRVGNRIDKELFNLEGDDSKEAKAKKAALAAKQQEIADRVDQLRTRQQDLMARKANDFPSEGLDEPDYTLPGEQYPQIEGPAEQKALPAGQGFEFRNDEERAQLEGFDNRIAGLTQRATHLQSKISSADSEKRRANLTQQLQSLTQQIEANKAKRNELVAKLKPAQVEPEPFKSAEESAMAFRDAEQEQTNTLQSPKGGKLLREDLRKQAKGEAQPPTTPAISRLTDIDLDGVNADDLAKTDLGSIEAGNVGKKAKKAKKAKKKKDEAVVAPSGETSGAPPSTSGATSGPKLYDMTPAGMGGGESKTTENTTDKNRADLGGISSPGQIETSPPSTIQPQSTVPAQPEAATSGKEEGNGQKRQTETLPGVGATNPLVAPEGKAKPGEEFSTAQQPTPTPTSPPDFKTMVDEAARWKGAAINADQALKGDNKARLKHNNETTKGALDAHLMNKFGIDEVTARTVSNELTAKNIPANREAKIEDYAGQPWADRVLNRGKQEGGLVTPHTETHGGVEFNVQPLKKETQAAPDATVASQQTPSGEPQATLPSTGETQTPETPLPGSGAPRPGTSEQVQPASGPVNAPPTAAPLHLEDHAGGKSFVVKGDTKTHKDRIKGLGGAWNKKLGGWIFSNGKRKQVEEALSDLLEAKTTSETNSTPIPEKTTSQDETQGNKTGQAIPEPVKEESPAKTPKTGVKLEIEGKGGKPAPKTLKDATPEEIKAEFVRQMKERQAAKQKAVEEKLKPTDKLKDASDHLKIIADGIKELNALFGEEGSFSTAPLDESKYAQAKVILQRMWDAALAAGNDISEFVSLVLDSLGEKVHPYFERFIDETLSTEGEKKGGISPHENIANWVRDQISAGKTFTSKELFDKSDEAYGGTQAQGKYTPKDAYDALELGINQYLLENGYGNYSYQLRKGDTVQDAVQSVRDLERLLERIPTQTKRTAEQDQFQQFSTPPTYAYVANWVANVDENDTYLEPSAGIGGLAVYGKMAGAKVIVNELSPRRREVLSSLPFDRVVSEDAAQLNNILPKDIKPTVVVMNPPFSAAAGRLSKNDNSIGAQHVLQALKRLQPGGRLVAIVGRGMAMDRATMRKWWDDVRAVYNVRANVGIDGKGYQKYGTTFDNQIIVIDKTGPTTGEIITGNVDNIAEAIPLLKGVRDDRTRETITQKQEPRGTDQSITNQPASVKGTETAQADTGPVNATLSATDAVGDIDRAGDGENREPSGTGRGNAKLEPEVSNEGTRPAEPQNRPQDNEPAGTGVGTPGSAANQSEREPSIELEQVVPKDGVVTDMESGSVYESYRPKKITVKGSKGHPGKLVESAAMASVDPITPTYKPSLGKDVIESGKLSDAQLEAVIYAGEAHSQMLRDGTTRRGFFIGDGTGVGKGREISGIIMDNWNKGRKKAIWISFNKSLHKDAQRDFSGIGGDPDKILDLSKHKLGSNIKANEGILFTTYNTLSMEKTDNSKEGAGKIQKRVEQIAEWFGKDFDGVIAFDEAHKMGNALEVRGKRGKSKPSKMALAGIELQRLLPNARVVYVSATGATEVMNLAYASRLGLWGEGTPFSNVSAFVSKISAGGMNAMELVARDLKAMGKYMARSLSYEDVEYATLEHPLTQAQTEIYDTLAGAWQIVLNNMNEALDLTGANGTGGAKSAAYSHFWGAQQRFFNQIITSMQTPKVIEDIKKTIADPNGPAYVLQIVNTNQAQQERAMDNLEEGDDLDMLDLSPRDQLMGFLERSFPVIQYEPYEDENGNTKVRPVVDSQGNPVLNAEAVAMRDRLLDEIGALNIPDNFLNQIINEFGTKIIAEVTGRSKRLVIDENGNRVIEKRSPLAGDAEAREFQEDKRRILIFSEKGGTGLSYHASLDSKNQRRRIHYVVQAGWSANKAVQGLGRTHRTNQANAPLYKLVTTNLKGQKRFLSSIARRLDQLGALTKGQRQTGSQGLFSARDNLESDYAREAWVGLVQDIYYGEVPNWSLEDFENRTGLRLLVKDQHGNPLGLASELPQITQFLNRMLSLKVNEQNEIFDAFSERLDKIIAREIEQGTLDAGMETLKAQSVKVVNEQTIYTDPESGAETKYMELDVTNPAPLLNFSESSQYAKGGYVRNVKSGNVWAVSNPRDKTNTSTGAITKESRLTSPTRSGQYVNVDDLSNVEKWEKLDKRQAKALWDDQHDKAPKTVTHRQHLITGVILPIWDRLSGHPRIMRVQTDDGNRFIGRLIATGDLRSTLERIGANASNIEISNADAVRAVLENNQKITLANGWEIRRSKVNGEYRIEIRGDDLYPRLNELAGYGIFMERINFQSRFFIPTGEQESVNAFEKLTKYNPIVSVSGGVQSNSDMAGRFDEDISNALYESDVSSIMGLGTVTADQLRAHFAPVATTTHGGPQLNIVETFDDLPERIRGDSRQRQLRNKVRGIIDRKNNQIYLIADKLGSVQQAEKTFLHEMVGHAGMESLVGKKKWNVFLDEVIALYGGRKGLKDIIDLYQLDSNRRDHMRIAASEKIARMAEANEKPGFLRRLYAAIREALRKMGFRVQLSEADIKAMLVRAQETLRANSPFDINSWLDIPLSSALKEWKRISEPKKKVKAYKLFRTNPKFPGEIFPLFVDANASVPMGEWVEAEAGEQDKNGKVKSKLGPLAYRPGWHSGDYPVATHIGGKNSPTDKRPSYRPDNQVWAEIEVPDDIDWQTVANSRARVNAKGNIVLVTAHITDQVPLGGHYRYKTNPNMQGNWIISGAMKVNRVLTDDEVKSINDAVGYADLPRRNGKDSDDPDISLSLVDDIKEESAIAAKTIKDTYADRTEAGAFQRILRTPAWWRHPVLKRLYEIAGIERPERVHSLLHNTLKLNEVLTPLAELKKSSPSEYEAVKAALLHMDATGETWDDYQEKANLSETARASVGSVRTLLDEALELQRRKVKDVIDILEGRGIDPKAHVIDEKAGPDGTPLTIWGLYQQMGSLEGSYFPRRREPGDWSVTSKKGDTQYREHFRTRYQAERAAAQYKKEGRTGVSGAMRVEREPESVYAALNMLDMQKFIEQALTRTGIDADGEIMLRKELFGEVADLLKERGFRSSRMARREGPPIKGFVEDPIEAVGGYAASLAGGIAKSEAAINMIQTVREGLDERKDPDRYDMAKEYIAEQLKNPDKADRAIAVAKSIVTFKYLGFGPKTALVNATSLLTSTPAAIHQYAMGGKGNFRDIGRALFTAMNDYRKVMTGKKLANTDEQAFMDALKGSANLEQYTRDAMAHLAGAYGKGWSKVMEASMWMFQKSENWVRGTTMLAAYRLARSQGKTHEEAVKLAKDTSNKAHATYNKASMPMWTMGSNPAAKIGQMGYTYLNFGHNYLQMLMDLGWSKKNYKAATFALLSPAILGGAGATIATPIVMAVAKGIMGAGGDDRDPEKVFAEMIRASLGKDAETAYRHGIFGLLGMDISGSLSIGMQAPKGFMDLIGPFGGVAQNVAQAAKFAGSGQFQKAGEELAPTFAANVSKAFRELSGATTRSGDRVWDEEGKPYIPTAGETIGKVFGFRSARRATIEEQRYEDKKEKQAYSERKRKIIDRYQAYLGAAEKDPDELQEIMSEVSEFNRKVKEAGRAYLVPYITRATMQREATKMKRPSSRELRAIRQRRADLAAEG